MSVLWYPTPKQSPIQGLSGMAGGAAGLGVRNKLGAQPGGGFRYWKFIEGGSPPVSHFPRMARMMVNSSESTIGGITIVTYAADNCSDSGTYTPGTFTYTAPLGTTYAFTHAYLYSVYNGGERAGNYTMQSSPNGSAPWTTRWTGVGHNMSSGFSWSAGSGSAQCGLIMMTGNGDASTY